MISPLTGQLRTSSRKVSVNYVGPVVVYKITDPMSFLPCTLNGKLLLGIFEYERFKPAVIRTCQGNVPSLSQLKHILHAGIKFN